MRAAIAARGLDIEFSVPAGEVMAVLGPNGAGKSTALHVVTGLVRPDSGLVRLGDRVLTDTGAGVNVATHDRRVGLLLQDPLLFPHLSAADNVAFAPRAQRRGRAAARERALHWLREVGAGEFADRKPRELSGGQAQRVAIARALAGEPDVLLLDEPMAGLDVAVAAAIRAVLRRVLARDGRSAMLVTHDLLDVVTLADHVLILEDGRVAETGRTADVLSAPRSGFGARLAGVNVVTGTVESAGVLRTPTGEFWHGIRRRSVDTWPAGRSGVSARRGGGLRRAAEGQPAQRPRSHHRRVRHPGEHDPVARGRPAWNRGRYHRRRRGGPVAGTRQPGVVCHQSPGGRPARRVSQSAIGTAPPSPHGRRFDTVSLRAACGACRRSCDRGIVAR